MKLFLVPSPTGAGSALHVRLTDAGQVQAAAEELNLGRYADAAYARTREAYPRFAYRLAKETGLLDLPGWGGRIAAYWLIPFSEKNPLRTRLINHLYRLLVVEAAIEQHQPTELVITGEDDRLTRLFVGLGEKHGLRAASERPAQGRAAGRSNWGGRLRRSRSILAAALRAGRKRLGLIREQWVIRRLLRGQAAAAMKAVTRSGRPLVAFYSRYPILWENADDGRARERNFGTFPEFLHSSGYDVAYPSTLSLPALDLRARLSEIFVRSQRLGVVFLESLLSLREFVSAYFNISHVWRYLKWRRRLGSHPIYFNGLDVKGLVLRDLDDDFLFDPDFPFNLARAYALRRFCQTYLLRAVCYPFEFQPMERAVYAGVKAGSPGTVVIGVQPGVFFSGWLSYVYAPGEIAARSMGGPDQAPLPDYLASYGTLFHQSMSSQLDPERLLLTGAIRYSDIQGESGAREPSLDGSGSDEVNLLLIGTPFRQETIRLLEAAAELARVRPEVFLLLKFHYHVPLHDEWERLADEFGRTRYKVFDDDLTSLLRNSTATLLGSTSVAAEAIAMGCMPIVLQSGDEYTFCPALDIREALFLCRDTASVVEAVGACIDRTQAYWERRRAWPDALEKMFYRLDGHQNQRLFDELRHRGVL